MYSIMIVDDERFTREGIAKVLPWNQLGIDRVDTADSGASALEKMDSHASDIVITDLEMNQIDGIELIRSINRRNPDVRIVVLTAHDDFSYVQECCRMEVHDYLLKPVDQEELMRVISQQVEALNRRQQERKQAKIYNRIYGISEQARVEQSIRSFLKDRTNLKEVQQIIADYGYEAGDALQVALISPVAYDHTEWQEHYELMNLSVKNTCIELVDYHHNGITVEDAHGTLVLILFLGKTHMDGIQLVEQLTVLLQEEYNIPQKVYLGSQVQEVVQLYISYHDALHLRLDAHAGRENIVQTSTERNRASLIAGVCNEFEKGIEQNLADTQRTLHIFSSYCQATEAYNMSLELIRHTCFQLLSNVYFYWLIECGATADNRLSSLMNVLRTAQQEEIFQTGREFLIHMLGNDSQKNSDVIQRAQNYIQSHLDQPLSVTQMAGEYYLSVAYFSKLFKKTVGVGCNTYIINRRMDMARQLLENTGMQVSLIAERVGYRDVNYFSLAFKKQTGCTPVEYRRQRRANWESEE